MRQVVVALAIVMGTAAVAGQQPAERWWSHVAFLASDAMKGRDTGTPEHRKAAEYIADQFKRAGLEPGGTKGYFQPVAIQQPPHRRSAIESRARALGQRPSRSCSATKRRSRCASSRRRAWKRRWCSPDTGCKSRRSKHDDLAGLDLKGKIVVLLTGGPSHIPGPLLAHYQSTRWDYLKKTGARRHDLDPEPEGPGHPVGSIEAVALHAGGGHRRSVARRNASASRWRSRSILPARRSCSPVPATPSPRSSRCRTTARCCRDLRCRRRARVKVAITATTLESDNVIGVLRGTDPALKQRIRRHLGASRSRWRRRADQRRHASTTAPWTTPRASRR